MCHSCIRREAWKMLAGNLLFVILVPVAITQLCRAYFGGSARSAAFAGLDAANALAKKGRVEEAGRSFATITDRLPAAAGVHFNHGAAMLNANDVDGAARQFERSLADCSNFGPSLSALYQCYEMQGNAEKLTALKSRLALMGAEFETEPGAESQPAEAQHRIAA